QLDVPTLFSEDAPMDRMTPPNSRLIETQQPLASYRQRVARCLQDNLAGDALWALGTGALGGAALGARAGAAAGAPFEGVGAVPGALAGGLAGGAIGAANAGLGAVVNDGARCLVFPDGIHIR